MSIAQTPAERLRLKSAIEHLRRCALDLLSPNVETKQLAGEQLAVFYHGHSQFPYEMLSDSETKALNDLVRRSGASGTLVATTDQILHTEKLIASLRGILEGIGDDAMHVATQPALSEHAAAVYDVLIALPVHRALTGPKILNALKRRSIYVEQSTLTSRIIPELKPYGIENAPRKGYRIRPDNRPS